MLLSDVCLSDVCLTSDVVCRVHREYSWRPQLPEARRAGRKACVDWSWAAAYRTFDL